MKYRWLIWVLLLGFLVSCSREMPIEESLSFRADTIARLMIVKFENANQLNYVIVQHPIKGFDTRFENTAKTPWLYYESADLTLNWNLPLLYSLRPMYSYEDNFMRYITNEIDLIKIPPYIPLIDNYYLINWKWWQIHPLSALTNSASGLELFQHINEHCFATDVQWTNLTDIAFQYDNDGMKNPVEINEIYRISYQNIDRWDNNYNPQMDYKKGVSLSEAYNIYDKFSRGALYVEDGTSIDEYSQKAWADYIKYMKYGDSIQNCYQQRLIQIINDNMLDKLSVDNFWLYQYE